MDIVDNLSFDIYPELTIDYVFKYVREEEIFAKYLGIPIQDVVVGKDLCNPLRDDNSPGCKFYYGDDGRLRFTDFAGYTSNGRFKSWDCFDCVVSVINMTERVKIPYYTVDKEKRYQFINLDISPNSGYIKFENSNHKYKRSKLSFTVMLKHIAKQFRIHEFSGATNVIEVQQIKADKTIRKHKRVFTELKPYFRDWNNYDLKYWRKYHVDVRNPQHKAVLKMFGINPLYSLFINGKQVYWYKNTDIAYSYFEGKDDKGRIHMKAYYPMRDGTERYKPRFHCNTKRLQGLHQLLPHRFGLLQKSKKDIAIQYLHYGLVGTAPQAESNILSKEEWASINYICPLWFSVGDFDYAGVRFGIAHYVKYRIEPLFFVRKNTPIKTFLGINDIHKLAKEFGFPIVKQILSRPVDMYFPAKDFTDNLEVLGVSKMREVIINVAKTYNLAINALIKHFDDNLNWINQ